jgi:hypothetical protein
VSGLEETGPIDFLVIEFQGKEINGELVPPLLDLVDRKLIRVLDALILLKRADGSYDALTTDELQASGAAGDLGELAGASSGLISEEDAEAAAAVMEPDTAALVLIYENLWAAPFAIAARKAGGQLVATGRIPVQALLAQLDALEAADA